MMYGNKIDNLIKLKEKGVNVPEFIIVKYEDKDNFKMEGIDNSKLYAVRSSSNIEDGIKNSFAGQFDTYLNVKPENIKDKINDCFHSLKNENVLEYIKENNIECDNMEMNVLVQEMVDSELSGVLFTSNPKGLLNEVVITIGEGLGENIVQDKIDTTTYYYNLNDKIYYYEGKNDYINKEIIEELINKSLEIKGILGEYLDIEFAIKDNKIYFLQARKITTLTGHNQLILDNSNIVESYPGISLPLTCSFANIIYTGVFRGLTYRILKNKKIVERYNDVFSNMVGSVNGRLYYKISNWYTFLKFLPFNSKIIPIWQEMLGVRNKDIGFVNPKISISTKMMTIFNYGYEFINVQKSMEKLNNEFIEVNKYFYENFSKEKSAEELIDLYNEVKNRLLEFWDITLINDMYSFLYTGLLKRKISNANEYISGISNIESMKPIKELINIAYKKNKISVEEFEDKVTQYIKIYGDRNLEELKLESKTFRTDKSLLENKINEYIENSKKLEELYNNMNTESEKLPIIPNRKVLKIIEKCKKGIGNREISRLNRSRIFGMVREIFLALGEKFEEQKIINNKQDIFYLTVEEAFELVKDKNNVKGIIEKRKDEYEIYKLLPAYSRLVFENKEFNKSHISINSNKLYLDKNKLKGIPCSDGSVEGEALIINDIKNIPDCSGKILITKMTDPGWVFLLATAKGVIAEKGSLLSHTAIISRELKIPSIVGVENLLNTIKNGDKIRMNGVTGEIEIIERVEQWNIENSNMKVMQ